MKVVQVFDRSPHIDRDGVVVDLPDLFAFEPSFDENLEMRVAPRGLFHNSGADVGRGRILFDELRLIGVFEKIGEDVLPFDVELVAHADVIRDVFHRRFVQFLLDRVVELVDDRFLVLEVAVDGPCADACVLRDHRDRRAVEAVVGDELERRMHNACFLVILFCHGGTFYCT